MVTAGEQFWDYIYISDVATAIARVVEREEARGVFNLGSGHHGDHSFDHRTSGRLIDPRLPIGFGEAPYRPDQVMHLEADISRLAALGWRPQVELHEGLAMAVAWYRQQASRRSQPNNIAHHSRRIGRLMQGKPRKLISIVTACFDEEPNLIDCRDAVRRLFAEQLPDYDFEHVFCDNCSTDKSPAILRQMAKEDPRIKVIFDAANFGPFRSNFNGVLSTSGDAVVVLLAADLQDPAEVIADFVRKWEEGYEVVHGIRANRQESLVMRNVRRVYYRLVSRFANVEIPNDVGEFQLIDRAVVDACGSLTIITLTFAA